MSAEALVGTWRMLAWELHDEQGTVHYPMGRDVAGYLMYTPDGYFAANLMLPGRAPYAGADIFAATDAELAAAARSYFAYCGRYRLEGETLHHQTEMSLVPNWVGATQVRYLEWTDEGMVLRSDPMELGGVRGRQRISWRRAG